MTYNGKQSVIAHVHVPGTEGDTASTVGPPHVSCKQNKSSASEIL